MNEAFKKIIERLEDKLLEASSAHAETTIGMCGISASRYGGEMYAYEKSIEIVKEVAEEYSGSKKPKGEE